MRTIIVKQEVQDPMSENRSPMPASPEPVPGLGHSRPVAVVTALDEVLRDSLVASLLLDAPGLVSLRYEVAEDSSALRRIVVAADGVLEDALVDLAHPCVSCAMREDAVPALARLADRPEVRGILLAPPLSADPSIVVGTLRAHEGAWHLASALAAASAARRAFLYVMGPSKPRYQPSFTSSCAISALPE